MGVGVCVGMGVCAGVWVGMGVCVDVWAHRAWVRACGWVWRGCGATTARCTR